MRRKMLIAIAVLLLAGAAFAADFGPSSAENYFLTKSTTVSLARKTAYSVSVDQATKMYLNDTTGGYVNLPSNTFDSRRRVNASAVVFQITSTAKTATPNLRIEFE